jgi:hypothetical protein
MSEAVVTTDMVALLLPPEVGPPLVSFVAPVITEAVAVAGAVGIPETGHEIDAPMANDAAGSVGEHEPTVTPGGRPVMAHETFVAAAVAVELFVHNTVPE